MARLLGGLRNLPQNDRAILAGCTVFPHDASRMPLVDACLATLQNVRESVVDAAVGASDAQVAGEFATKIYEQRQALHNFWIQAAQLILVNLLLPLLTALFGYIFGTQQAQRQNAADPQ